MQEKKFVTVGQLAKELCTPVEGVLKQFEAAGIPKQSSRSRVNMEDQEVFLDFLKTQNRQSALPFTKLRSREQALIIDVQNSKNGSEYTRNHFLSSGRQLSRLAHESAAL